VPIPGLTIGGGALQDAESHQSPAVKKVTGSILGALAIYWRVIVSIFSRFDYRNFKVAKNKKQLKWIQNLICVIE
jgi:hypothetical protein